MVVLLQELEEHLTGHGLPIPPPDPSLLALTQMRGDAEIDRHRPQQSYPFHRQIKSEPLEEEQTPQPTPQPMPNHPPPSFHPASISTTNTAVQQDPAVAMRQEHSPAPIQTQDGREQVQQQNRMDYNPAMIGGHSYAISDAQFSSIYSSAMAPFTSGTGGVLETPPVVNNNLSPFGQPRLPAGHGGPPRQPQQHEDLSRVHQQRQQQHQQLQELMMDLGGDGTGVVGGNPSVAALVSSADPLMSDSRLINSQVASPEIQWEAQSFSPENEQMDFAAP